MTNLAFGEFSVFGQQLRELIELSGGTRYESGQQLSLESGRDLATRLALRRSNDAPLLLSALSLANAHM